MAVHQYEPGGSALGGRGWEASLCVTLAGYEWTVSCDGDHGWDNELLVLFRFPMVISGWFPPLHFSEGREPLQGPLPASKFRRICPKMGFPLSFPAQVPAWAKEVLVSRSSGFLLRFQSVPLCHLLHLVSACVNCSSG